MKKIYLKLALCLFLTLLNTAVFSQGFDPKDQQEVQLLKSVNDANKSIRISNLFTFPEGIAQSANIGEIGNLSINSSNPSLIEANGFTAGFNTTAQYIVKGQQTGNAILTIGLSYEGTIYHNTVAVRVVHVIATSDEATVAPEGSILIDVLKNDQPKADLDGSSIEILTQPNSGTASVIEEEGVFKIKYESNKGSANYSADKLTYRVADTFGNYSAPTQVSIKVNYSPYVSHVIEYKPAPGQFINKSIGLPKDAQNVIGAPGGIVSLGGFGGYIVVGFEQPIQNSPQNPYGVDFTVIGNAFAGWTEPGAVMVMKDENGNGIPDDTWYELAGSEFHFSNAKQVSMTYSNPRNAKAEDVIWTTDQGSEGVLRKNNFHAQPYYPQSQFFDNVDANYQDYTGTKINIRVDRSNPSYITSGSFAFGYADNKSRNNNPTVPTNPYFNDENGNSSDGFDISWAVDGNVNSVELDEIHFVKIYTAAQEDAGWLGETSTEVDAVVITTPDPNWVQKDYFVQLIGSAPFQILKGDTHNFEGLLFKNGIPQEATATWSISDFNIGAIDGEGKFTAKEIGNVEVQFSADSELPLATFTIEVVELADMVLTSSKNTLYINEQTYVHAEGIDQRLAPRNRFIYDTYTYTVSDETIATVSDNGIVTALGSGEVTVTATSNADPSISASVSITISEAPRIELVAGNDHLVYEAGVGTARIDLDTVFNVLGSGQIFHILKDNNNEFLLDVSIDKFRYLDLVFEENVAGKAVVTIAATAYKDTVEFPITIEVLPKNDLLKPKQIVFVNGGQFGSKKGNIQVYNPANDITEKLLDLEVAESVQDLVTEGQYLYVSAEYDIIKYDLISKTEVAKRHTQDTDPDSADGLGKLGAGVNHSMALYKDWLITTRQNSSYATEDGYNVRIYNKNDLSLVKKIPVSTEGAGVIVVGDSAFVALNGGFMGTSGQLAIIDLVNLELKEEFDFGADGTSIMQMFNKDKTLHILAQGKLLTYSIPDRTYALHELPIGHADYSSSPLGTTIIDDKLYTKINWGNYEGEHKGFGIVDLTDFTVVENDLIGMDTDPDITTNGLAMMASAYDTTDHKFYFTFGQWWGDGLGRIYDEDGSNTGSFNNVEDSPERLVVSYDIVNQLPYLVKKIEEATVEEGTVFIIDFDNYFKDDGALAYTVSLEDGSSLPEWMKMEGSILTAAPIKGIEKAVWNIKITAADLYNKEASTEFIIHTLPVDNPPVVANPIKDIKVKENSDEVIVSLESVFEDKDSPEELMTYSIIENTNEGLIHTAIDGKSLILNFTEKSFGEATITVQVTSEGKTATTSFHVFVEEEIISGISDKLATVTFYPNPVKDQLSIKLGTGSPTKIELFNSQGLRVIYQETNRSEEVLNTNTLSGGIYILVISNKNGQLQHRIIKQ